jgi:hypothetical protein
MKPAWAMLPSPYALFHGFKSQEVDCCWKRLLAGWLAGWLAEKELAAALRRMIQGRGRDITSNSNQI